MSYSPDIVKYQVKSLLNLDERDTDGVPTYGNDILGDTAYSIDEIERAVQNASNTLMLAVCETPGHPLRGVFTNAINLGYAESLPPHYGPMAVPRIVPYPDAEYTIVGKRKSVEEISAYRANLNAVYSITSHDTPDINSLHSKLAGFYAIDNNIFYFTGFSADADVTYFEETDAPLLPDSYHGLGIALAIAQLAKDGSASSIFGDYAAIGQQGLAEIRGKETDQPSRSKTIGSTRDSGTK